MGYLDIANAAPAKKRSYLDIANEAPTKKEIAKSPIFSVTESPINQDVITPTDIITGMVPWKATGGIFKERVTKPAVLNIAKQLPDTVFPIERLPIPKSIADIGFRAGTQISPRKGFEMSADIISDPRTYLPGGLPKGSQKALGAVEKGLMTPIEATKKALAPEAGQIGSRLPGIFKLGRDYLYEKVAKPAADIISTNLKKFPEFAKKLGVKDETIKLIKQHGYERVANAAGIEEEASLAFKEALAKKTGVYGNKIDIRNTLSKMERMFNQIKKIDPNNKLGQLIENLKKLRPEPKGFYAEGAKVPTATQLKRLFRGQPLTDIAGEVRITRQELSNLRDQLSNLYKDRAFDRSVYEIIDSLYMDAEKAGLSGINKARQLFKQSRQFGEVAKDLTKIEKLDPARILSDLNTVKGDPSKYKMMVDKYSNYIGPEKAKQIFDQAISVRRGGKILKYGAGGTTVGLAGKGAIDIFK